MFLHQHINGFAPASPPIGLPTPVAVSLRKLSAKLHGTASLDLGHRLKAVLDRAINHQMCQSSVC